MVGHRGEAEGGYGPRGPCTGQLRPCASARGDLGDRAHRHPPPSPSAWLLARGRREQLAFPIHQQPPLLFQAPGRGRRLCSGIGGAEARESASALPALVFHSRGMPGRGGERGSPLPDTGSGPGCRVLCRCGEEEEGVGMKDRGPAAISGRWAASARLAVDAAASAPGARGGTAVPRWSRWGSPKNSEQEPPSKAHTLPRTRGEAPMGAPNLGRSAQHQQQQGRGRARAAASPEPPMRAQIFRVHLLRCLCCLRGISAFEAAEGSRPGNGGGWGAKASPGG